MSFIVYKQANEIMLVAKRKASTPPSIILGNKRSADFLGASCFKKTTLAKFLLPASSIAFL